MKEEIILNTNAESLHKLIVGIFIVSFNLLKAILVLINSYPYLRLLASLQQYIDPEVLEETLSTKTALHREARLSNS